MTVNSETIVRPPDANELLLTGGKAPDSADFGPTFPSTVAGRLLAEPHTYRAREYNSANPGAGKLRTFEDGTPVFGVWVDLDVPGIGIRRLYVEKPRMLSAVRDAMIAAGVARIEGGGWLAVSWVGTEQGAGAMPANVYTATYTKPGPNPLAVGNGATSAPVPVSVPTSPPAAPAPAPVPVGAPAPAAWQSGAPAAPYQAGTTAPVPAPAPAPAPNVVAPGQPAPVLTASMAAAMANLGIDVSAYTVVPDA